MRTPEWETLRPKTLFFPQIAHLAPELAMSPGMITEKEVRYNIGVTMFSFSDPIELVLFVAALLTAITVHEASHAWTADRLGDPTPRLQGRLTLNPLRHLDPIGTLMLLIFRFGWGKPVQFDPYNLKDPQRDSALISFAGPASNFITATALGILVRLEPTILPYLAPFIQLNIVLGIFNLIPIHPLDGGKVLVGLLEGQTARSVDRFLQQFGILLLIFMILPLFNGIALIQLFLLPLIQFFLGIFIPQAPLI